MTNARWRHLRAEHLPADLPPARVVTFAQSFHWLDRPRVAAAARRMLVPGGAVAHVHATTHEGVDTDAELPRPAPPRAAIDQLAGVIRVVERPADEVAASIYSLSGSAPHLFGDRFEDFDTELRSLLAASGDNGFFGEQMRSIIIDIWG